MEQTYQYEAFISYFQDPDKAMAIAIRDGLMQLGAKKYLLRFRAMEVFRDETNAYGEGGLSQRIYRGMDNSRLLILLARPEITRSSTAEKKNWVEAELRYWIEKIKRERLEEGEETDEKINWRVIVCVMNGEILWDNAPVNVDSPQQCLHSLLAGKISAEEPWVDFREIQQKIDKAPDQAKNFLSLKDPDFLRKIANLSGLIQGKSVDEMIAEDRRNQRVWSVFLIFVAVALLILAITAFSLKKIADDNRKIAQAQAALAKRKEREAENSLEKYEFIRLKQALADAQTFDAAGGPIGIRKRDEVIDTAFAIINRYAETPAFVGMRTSFEKMKTK
jgi:hypothetical protein